MSTSFIIILIISLILIYFLMTYNKFIILKNYVNEAFSTMDIYLKKRWDLVPNLIELAKGYCHHENSIFEKITELRSENYSNLTPDEKMDLNNRLSVGLSQLSAVFENYPDLKANQIFVDLQSRLAKIEEDIANSRKYYNGTTREYNTSIQMFPAMLIANLFNFKTEKLYEIAQIQRENIEISF